MSEGTGMPCPDCGAMRSEADTAREICPRCLIGVGLDESLVDSGGDGSSHDAGRMPDEIGPYRILEQVGEGGMGVVYRAEQTEPIRRIVALKLIKLGMDTRRVIARFEGERQTLAVMTHPNIARVHDAGVDRDGRPYFVMEYVDGRPITRYCEEERGGLERKLALFEEACNAVQHAHHKGIVHRDIKASNVLVADEDGRPTVKVIDFGIAKAIDPAGGTPAGMTAADVMMGTPETMSPEQAAGGADVDTRADVYSLGVLLYRLLCGALPFDSQRLRKASVDEMRRIIREEPVMRPSLRAPGLARELDWIALKAMDKDRDRRYGSPHELVADLRRFLAGEPVLAGPPTAAYRLTKFVRRHRVAVGFSTLAIAGLLGVAVALAVQSRQIARERDRANDEAQAARFVSNFLIDLFEVSDPGEARGNSIQAREILDRGAERISSDPEASPEVRARLMATIGTVYKKLGLYAEAEPLLESALEVRSRTLGRDHEETIRTTMEIAELRFYQGDLVRAESELRDALARSRASLGDEHPDTLSSLGDLAVTLHFQGKLDEAERLYLEALELRRRVLGPDHEDTLETTNNLAALFYSQGNLNKAEPYMLEALEGRRRRLGDDHPETLDSMINLAVVLQTQGKLPAAEKLSREAVEIGLKIRPDHPKTWVSINNLGMLLTSQERYDEAVEQYRRAIDVLRRTVGDDHVDTLTAVGNLGDLYTRQGRFDEALPLLEEALAGVRRTLPSGHLAHGYSLRKLGRYQLATGRLDEAEATLLDAYRITVAAAGEGHAHSIRTAGLLVALYETLGRPSEAEAWRLKLP